MEKLVEVVQEYPTEVEHIYSPSCVPLVRCAGCCGDENLECHPTETSNVTMQVRKQQKYLYSWIFFHNWTTLHKFNVFYGILSYRPTQCRAYLCNENDAWFSGFLQIKM
ncbi:hypothetical protein ILYODFUR_037286 [Ilyodon furcidens]